MEMNLRDWLVIIGVLVVLGVLADGLRRMWLARRKENELSFGLEDVQGQGDDFGSELPNGGARLRELDDEFALNDNSPVRAEPFISEPEPELNRIEEPELDRIEEPVMVDMVSEPRVRDEARSANLEPVAAGMPESHQPAPTRPKRPAPKSSELEMAANHVLPGQQALALDEPVPVLMDMDDSHLLQDDFSHSVVEPARTAPERIPSRQPVGVPTSAEKPEPVLSAEKPKKPESRRRVKSREPIELVAERDVEPPAVSVQQEHHISSAVMEEVLVINAVAPEGQPFPGDQLLKIFQAEGLRFGDMNIFHRHVQEDGSGQILFSVANGVEPGTFDLKSMERSFTPALSFFMSLPGPEQPHQAFRILVEAIDHLSRELGGILRDEQHSVLTAQTLEHYRQRISDFERRQLTHRNKSTARV
ncbi:cell division protein ZipA [Parendozoicomonas sp. Alg238-R29]|uniref:cell division protein ZipA n=1 Tax=Parendozoicomonas sp. Alg238-R29 TaxID=2993446 RepID=UPI00248F2A83|nr:cell division protein ZipA [Parendozoicomonas sp. Alg238-R29]